MVDKVTDASFEQDVLKATGPVVVDFWAEWCGPCRMIAPALEEISKSLNGKVKIVKLNVDENPGTAAKFGIMSIPTLMLFKNGELASRQIGAAPKQKIARRCQCLKCRTPVNTMAMPASSAALITSSSRTEPPG
jgi:thioredoxin 1